MQSDYRYQPDPPHLYQPPVADRQAPTTARRTVVRTISSYSGFCRFGAASWGMLAAGSFLLVMHVFGGFGVPMGGY